MEGPIEFDSSFGALSVGFISLLIYGTGVTCDLSKDELDMLYYLISSRGLSEKHSIAQKAIERDLGTKMDIRKVLQSLMNKGYANGKKKKPVNYWAIAGKAAKALRVHGYDVPLGNAHRLM